MTNSIDKIHFSMLFVLVIISYLYKDDNICLSLLKTINLTNNCSYFNMNSSLISNNPFPIMGKSYSASDYLEVELKDIPRNLENTFEYDVKIYLKLIV